MGYEEAVAKAATALKQGEEASWDLARLTYEATPATSPGELASTPPAMTAPPAMPVLSVRLGDSTRGQPDCGEWEGFGVS